MADIRQQVAQARKAGYSDAEIVAFLGKTDPRVSKAKQSGYKDAEIVSFLSTPPKAAAPKVSSTQTAKRDVSGAISNVFNQVPFFQDMAAGVGTALDPRLYRGEMSVLQSYENNRKAIRDDVNQLQERRPYMAAAAQAGGMGASMFVPGLKGVEAVSLAPQGAGLVAKTGNVLANAARGAVTAGTAGAVYGLGSDGTAAQRLKAGADSAKTSAVVGALTPLALAAVEARRVSGATKKANKVAPDLDKLKSQTRAAYKAVDDAGVRYTPTAFNEFVDGVTDEMKAASISASRHPKAASMLADIQAMKGKAPTLTELDQLRQVMRRDVASASDDAERFFGQKMIANLDEFIDAATDAQVKAGSASGASRMIKNARELNTRARKVESVQDALEAAELRAGRTGSGGNIDNAMRQELSKVLTKSRNLTPQEKAALKDIVMGSKGQNALRMVGKLSPAGNGLMQAGHLLALGPTGGVSALAAAAGAGSKVAADAMTKTKIGNLVNLMASGGGKAQDAERELAKLAARDPEVRRIYNAVAAKILRAEGAASASGTTAR